MRLVLTPGMGIGPEVTARALQTLQTSAQFSLLGDADLIAAALDSADLSYTVCAEVFGAPGTCVVDTRGDAEPAPVGAIRLAAEVTLAGHADALVTGPINKARLIAQGFTFMGHTDMLGALCSAEPVMAFAGGTIRVALVTAHVPLASVTDEITPERVGLTVRMAQLALTTQLGIAAPRIALCGLNPHAGEQGKLGSCETDVLEPTARVLRAEGIDLVGPISAETAFMKAAGGDFDMVVAMYHDQGLVPLKVLDFGRSVNWTLGLPIIRTSVDHGTADDLVGTGEADPASMIAAIRLAIQLVNAR